MHRTTSLLFAVVLIAVLAACNGSTTVPTRSPVPSGPDLTQAPSAVATSSATTSTEPIASPSAPPTPAGSPAETMLVRAYFVLGGEPGSVGLVPILRTVPRTVQAATAAMDALLAGPTANEAGDRTITTAIPDGTRLLGVSVKTGVATVDLSTEFDSDGATASMRYRLAQVVYTLTQFTTVRSVVFQVEGQTVTVFGSTGIVLAGPVERADYYDQLPSIFVDRPAYRAALENPGRVAGNADVFEATFRVALLDATGKTLLDEQVLATCGTGCRGTFDTSLTYTVAKGQYGTLRVYDLSAKDGTRQDVRDYPVWLTPAG